MPIHSRVAISVQTAFHMMHRAATIAALAAVWLSVGCSSPPAMVSTPNLFSDSTVNPYESVPTELQGNSATVVYATDRQPETIEGVYSYSAKRSRQVSFGLCTVRMGQPETTWDELVAASRTRKRKQPVPLMLASIEERGHWSPFGAAVEIDGRWIDNPEEAEIRAQETRKLHALLAERLALTPRKELFVFVHGYNNSFESGAFRVSQMWHFTGRGGVPVLFSWPAVRGCCGDTRVTVNPASSPIRISNFSFAISLPARRSRRFTSLLTAAAPTFSRRPCESCTWNVVAPSRTLARHSSLDRSYSQRRISTWTCSSRGLALIELASSPNG